MRRRPHADLPRGLRLTALTVASAERRRGETLSRVALPPVTRTQLVHYCAAAGVGDPIHFDVGLAKAEGFADVVVNGSLRQEWLALAATDLIAEPDFLESFTCQHRAVMLVGQAASIDVVLTDVAVDADGARATCTVTNRIDGTVFDEATAVLRLRSR